MAALKNIYSFLFFILPSYILSLFPLYVWSLTVSLILSWPEDLLVIIAINFFSPCAVVKWCHQVARIEVELRSRLNDIIASTTKCMCHRANFFGQRFLLANQVKYKIHFLSSKWCNDHWIISKRSSILEVASFISTSTKDILSIHFCLRAGLTSDHLISKQTLSLLS